MADKALVSVSETFAVGARRDQVWYALGDVLLIADCMPNASLTPGAVAGSYEGSIAVKFGPITAAFKGTLDIERNDAEQSGKIISRGIDKFGSRVSSSMNYRLTDRSDGERGTCVSLDGTIEVVGALAKFAQTGGKLLARSVTKEFAAKLASRLGTLG